MKSRVQMPDFAGTALVDILANGLAMLIIVIVLSISARGEREQRTASQVEEVETMMSRRFSTSLILNSLAASKPAQLHDYRNSPLDQEYDPQTLPILELHRDFVREFYSGAIWSREQLLREPNAMDDWLSGFDDARKLRLRTDVYDIAQFYLAMSILRDHNIVPRHWHFLPGGLGLKQAGACPPAVSAQDCGSVDGAGSMVTELPTLTERTSDATGESNQWPPSDLTSGAGGTDETDLNQFPSEATIGLLPGATGFGAFAEGTPVELDPLASSFPNARPGSGSSNQMSRGAQQSTGLRFRLSAPESVRQNNGQALSMGDTSPTVEQVLTVLFDFIGKLQEMLDAGVSPSDYLANFEQLLNRAFASLPTLDTQTHALMSTLIWDVFQNLARASQNLSENSATGVQQSVDADNQSLNIITLELADRANTALILAPNKRLQQVFVAQARAARPVPEVARPMLRLNTYPDVWRGLSLPIESNSILLMSPKQQHINQLRWRAVAYIAPNFDDFIIGFIYATVDTDGRLVVPAEDNRVSLNGRPLLTPHHAPLFGARGWLVTLYAGLIVCLLGFLLLVRRMTTKLMT